MIETSTQRPILKTEALTKSFGGVTAVTDVNFELRQGEVRCLIGPNGAGKSTFFKMLSGQIQPTAGRVLFDGKDIVGSEAHAIGKLGLGIKNQVPDVMNGLTVRENLWLAARARNDKSESDVVVDALAEQLSLSPIMNRIVGELAHGQRQWVEIGCVIATRPRIILLDEPAAGMSGKETERTAELILSLSKSATIVVVEHDMQFIQLIAQKVTVFHRGAILMEDSFDKVATDPVVRDVYLGRGK